MTQEGQGRWTRYRLFKERSQHKEERSQHKNSQSNEFTLTEEKLMRLEKIAKLSKNQKRLPPKELEKIILQLCEHEWLTRKQLVRS